MEEVLIELLNHLGFGRGAYIGSIELYCRKLNEYTNDKFNFHRLDSTPNGIIFQQGEKKHLLILSFMKDSDIVVDNIIIVEDVKNKDIK